MSSRSCIEDADRSRAGPVPRTTADDAAAANCAINMGRMNRSAHFGGLEKDIAERIVQPAGDPALRQMVVAVLNHVTALAEAPRIAQPIVLRLVVEMRQQYWRRVAAPTQGYVCRFVAALNRMTHQGLGQPESRNIGQWRGSEGCMRATPTGMVGMIPCAR
jgi:hypothetical protein